MILSIDTTGPLFTIALYDENKAELFFFEEQAPQMQAKHLVPAIKQACQACYSTINILKKIVINIGPGSFTGIRIGLAAAQGMALALRIPLYGITSFEALTLLNASGGSLITIDAGRGNYYCQEQQDSSYVNQPFIMSIDEIKINFPSHTLVGALGSSSITTDARLIAAAFFEKLSPVANLDVEPVYVGSPVKSVL